MMQTVYGKYARIDARYKVNLNLFRQDFRSCETNWKQTTNGYLILTEQEAFQTLSKVDKVIKSKHH